jgi:hypothetical protein
MKQDSGIKVPASFGPMKEQMNKRMGSVRHHDKKQN